MWIQDTKTKSVYVKQSTSCFHASFKKELICTLWGNIYIPPS